MTERTWLPPYITTEMVLWANANGVTISKGEIGFGRDCVGLLSGTTWIYWRRYDASNDYEKYATDPIDWGEHGGYLPPDAYHKSNCVTVLFGGPTSEDDAWRQLARWINEIMKADWRVQTMNRNASNIFDAAIHGVTDPLLVPPPEDINDRLEEED